MKNLPISTLGHFKKAAVSAEIIAFQVALKIKETLANASTRTERTGIMSFVQMIAQDDVNLSLGIVRNDSDITVSSFNISRPELLNKYAPLANQVKQYLESNLEVFPTRLNGELVEYKNFAFQVSYS